MGSLALGLIRSQSRSLRSLASHPNGGDRPASRARLPSHRGPLLRDERAIIPADSFQSASRTRLGLAHPTIQNHCRLTLHILLLPPSVRSCQTLIEEGKLLPAALAPSTSHFQQTDMLLVAVSIGGFLFS